MHAASPDKFTIATEHMIVLACINECLPGIISWRFGAVRDAQTVASEQQLDTAVENLSKSSLRENILAKNALDCLRVRSELLESIESGATSINSLVAYGMGIAIGNVHKSLAALHIAIIKPLN